MGISEGAPKPPHVIVVDDELLVALMFEDALRRTGYRVTIARNGRDALSVHEADPAAAVVTDLHMPGMDGMELMRRLRARWPSLPVLVVSAWRGAAGTGSLAGATAFLAKPVSPRTVVRQVTSLLEPS